MTAITSLTAHGIKVICEAENPAVELKNKYYVMQVIEVKVFS